MGDGASVDAEAVAAEAGVTEAGIGALGAELRTLVSALYRRYRSHRPPGELGDAATSVLLRLQKKGPQTLTALCEHAGVSLGSMSQTIRRLEELHYVDRSKDPADGRRVLLSATDTGATVAADVRARMEGWFDGQLAALEPDERTRLAAVIPILRKLAAND
ncbi:MarR family winged helix-turn-helix transcriptional regulator [Raineyella sp. W15-4]|uniref:MarR family winged helix-turn-helix transcriptional regulator n=1 Tax=Raineyella sp. W15-4 TaxID=3081651 RepID=UPI0029547E4A|nr:MarR family winged helix-turn-helix transcriptional regulator [Raineyella sp. W15-4]WOQ17658.1 MarR family winged helix-turn-helix transcriptional regulator [Raineyella sp. W15-4]